MFSQFHDLQLRYKIGYTICTVALRGLSYDCEKQREDTVAQTNVTSSQPYIGGRGDPRPLRTGRHRTEKYHCVGNSRSWFATCTLIVYFSLHRYSCHPSPRHPHEQKQVATDLMAFATNPPSASLLAEDSIRPRNL
jgi:hypothetical protein